MLYIFSDSTDTDMISEPEDEQWDENEELANDISEDSEPDNDSVTVDDVSHQSSALAQWLALFLLRIKSVHRLSDTVISCLFKFLWVFIYVLGRYSSVCAEIVKSFPSSLYKANKIISKPNIRRYVTCRKCHTLYFVKDCILNCGTAETGKKCSFQRYPSHPQHRMRATCSLPLMKTVEFAGGRQILYPYRIYSYLSIESSIQSLFSRPNFRLDCEKWRSRQINDGSLADVYDGKVWKEFLCWNGVQFLSEPYNLALTLNFDFFQPYKHIQYSVGAIYLTIMNLPRELRYKPKNVVLVGLIPGPHEPKHDINSYISPLVDELLKFWNGINLNIHSISGKKSVRCALLCVACDLPAGRKICGFPSFCAHYGCSRCFKRFPGGIGSMDYSGFEREKWPSRSGTNHCQVASTLTNFRTKAQQEAKESNAGCRYSELVRLPYFDPPRMLVVDPMHNLFLGTAKHYLKNIWMEKGIVSQKNFELIQQSVDSAIVPAGIGRIPSKILSGFSSFTAEQWKNWVTLFSLLSLQDCLQGDDLECWRHFVLACRILTKYRITANDIVIADGLLLQFCKRTERQYGKNKITPNMHMHCHLRSCIEDYGPLHGFWLFAFERYNGILGSIPNNNRCIEVQMMNRFVMDGLISNIDLPLEFKDDFGHFFVNMESFDVSNMPHSSTTGDDGESSEWTLTSDVVLPSRRSRYAFNDEEIDQVKHVLTKLYSVSRSCIQVSRDCWKYKSIQMHGKRLGSHFSRSRASSIVMATWRSDILGCPSADFDELPSEILRAARVNHFLLQTIYINDKAYTHLLVCLSWYRFHPKMYSLGKPLSVWHSNFELFKSIIPVQLVKHRTVSLSTEMDSTSVLLVSPCVQI